MAELPNNNQRDMLDRPEVNFNRAEEVHDLTNRLNFDPIIQNMDNNFAQLNQP